MIPPVDAEFFTLSIEDFDWPDPSFRGGQEIYLKFDPLPSFKTSEEAIASADLGILEKINNVYWWHPQQYKWLSTTFPKKEDMEKWADEQLRAFPEFEIRKVIAAKTLAQITVKMAQVLRDHGINCRYNEDLNCLQHGLVEGYFDEWLDQPACAEYGAYDYWENIHQELGITRPKDIR